MSDIQISFEFYCKRNNMWLNLTKDKFTKEYQVPMTQMMYNWYAAGYVQGQRG